MIIIREKKKKFTIWFITFWRIILEKQIVFKLSKKKFAKRIKMFTIFKSPDVLTNYVRETESFLF